MSRVDMLAVFPFLFDSITTDKDFPRNLFKLVPHFRNFIL